MHKLWFVVPAHGRFALTKICLRQLRRTCDALADKNIEASAVVIADDTNLELAAQLGFATIRRDNDYLARKFNDGFELALSQRYNPRPADFVVPFGSDDWVDPDCFDLLPGDDTVIAFRHAAFVDEFGTSIVHRDVDYEAGVGIRIYPRAMMKRLDFRPADEDRKRGCDTSILVNLRTSFTKPRHEGNIVRSLSQKRQLQIVYNDKHPYQIVDWKSADTQLNSYETLFNRFRGTKAADPFETLAGKFPAEALDEMREHYAWKRSLVLA